MSIDMSVASVASAAVLQWCSARKVQDYYTDKNIFISVLLLLPEALPPNLLVLAMPLTDAYDYIKCHPK